MMELCRIASHLVAIGSTGNEMGATTIMTIGFRAREEILRIFERITGLRMNHEYIRPRRRRAGHRRGHHGLHP